MESRILLLALRGRDAVVLSQLLGKNHKTIVCSSPAEIADALVQGAGTAIITEESLIGADRSPLENWLASQDSWSDFPFILLATKRMGSRSGEAQTALGRLGNVIVLERPIHSDTLSSAVNSALRVRARQYEARSRLLALQSAEEGLRLLNGSLEARVEQRTEALSRANNQLMQEIAERERAQAALVQAQKMETVGQLTGGIAHDFNNLLTVISGNIELIQLRAKDERISRNAGFARHAVDRAAKLTHQLLAFSRTQQLTLAPVDLNGLMEGMNDLIERTIGPQIKKVRSFDQGNPWVMADVNQLELAVLNLAINARDAMPGGGQLTFETGIADGVPEGAMEGRYGVVRVMDNGAGIPKHILPKVFDPFFTTKDVGKGTGLGLSQVFGIAQQSGGIARIDTAEGHGTTVSIFLPLAERPARSASPGDDRPETDTLRHGTILVVDDDDEVRRFIVESLESLGYTVTEAQGGEAGLRSIASAEPDILIVDFAMPGLTGVDVAKAAHKLAPRLPIILASGYAEVEESQGVNLFHSVIRKPFRIDALAQATRAALSTRVA
ncbi:ATP-binding protein [Sphingobium boeckii]|uniref:histidine kinase n=1 Tax=Sphingobium boeckii TaxID=1082345 RepID=A0A7W9EGU8_9SPHN|nr:ATP-binding protein [Sphingobium boeckii]MBB5687096.1 signal transduction histidine kinase [Sphingobium boeckii]